MVGYFVFFLVLVVECIDGLVEFVVVVIGRVELAVGRWRGGF